MSDWVLIDYRSKGLHRGLALLERDGEKVWRMRYAHPDAPTFDFPFSCFRDMDDFQDWAFKYFWREAEEVAA